MSQTHCPACKKLLRDVGGYGMLIDNDGKRGLYATCARCAGRMAAITKRRAERDLVVIEARVRRNPIRYAEMIDDGSKTPTIVQ